MSMFFSQVLFVIACPAHDSKATTRRRDTGCKRYPILGWHFKQSFLQHQL